MTSKERWNSYLFEYDHDGQSWSFSIPARDEQEARERVNKLPDARYLGEIKMALTVPRHTTLLARIASRARNIFGFT